MVAAYSSSRLAWSEGGQSHNEPVYGSVMHDNTVNVITDIIKPHRSDSCLLLQTE